MENFGELELLQKIDNGDGLTEEELEDFIWYCGKTVATIEGDCHRWTQEIQTVKQIGDRFFSVQWDRGLTERQENEFWNQPIEVVPQDKYIRVTEWMPMCGEDLR